MPDSLKRGLLLMGMVVVALSYVTSLLYIQQRYKLLSQDVSTGTTQHHIQTLFFDVQSRVRQWELVSPHCLKSGYMPLRKGEQADLLLDEPRFSARVSRPYQMEPSLFIHGKLALSQEQPLLLCFDEGYALTTLKRVETGNTETKLTLGDLRLSKEGLKAGEEIYVVVLSPVRYYETQEADGSKILYRSAEGSSRPMVMQLEGFSFSAARDEDWLHIELHVASQINLMRYIDIRVYRPIPAERWYLRQGLLVKS